jgi:hypothetical protein
VAHVFPMFSICRGIRKAGGKVVVNLPDLETFLLP